MRALPALSGVSCCWRGTTLRHSRHLGDPAGADPWHLLYLLGGAGGTSQVQVLSGQLPLFHLEEGGIVLFLAIDIKWKNHHCCVCFP